MKMFTVFTQVKRNVGNRAWPAAHVICIYSMPAGVCLAGRLGRDW